MTINTIKFSQFAAGSFANANYIVGVTALSSGTNLRTPAVNSWTTAGRPVTPVTGTLGYNTSLGQYEYWNGAAWVQLGAGGSGSVNLGGAGQVAYYATTGTAVSGTNLLPNTVALQGITDGTLAASGVVGEFVSSVVLFGSSISLTTFVPANLTSISLTAGDWDVWGNLHYHFTISAQSEFAGWTSSVSATQPDDAFTSWSNQTITDGDVGFAVPEQVYNITTTTTIYLTAYAGFPGGSASQVCGAIYARRRR